MYYFVKSLESGVDNVDKLGLEGSTADKETVNVGLVLERSSVLAVGRATVDDADGLSGLLAKLGGQEGADLLVDTLGVVGGGSKTGANGPDGLVGNDDAGPVLDLVNDGLELALADVEGLVGLTLLKGLTNAENDVQAIVKGKLGLVSNELVRLLDDGAALGVTENDPLGTNVLDLVNRDLTSEGTVALVESVLGSNRDSRSLQVLLGPEKVGEGRRDDDLDVVSELGAVEAVDNGLDGLLGAVHLEVTTNKESASL